MVLCAYLWEGGVAAFNVAHDKYRLTDMQIMR